MNEEIFPYNIVCVTDVKLCEVTRENFVKLVSENYEVGISLISSLLGKLKRANEKNLILQENDALIRLVNFMLEIDERTHGDIELTIDNIAASINLRRETVSRKLKDLIELSLIEREGQSKIKVLDRNGLKNIIS
ncbi:transcriptional regulator FixK [Chlamydia trachomatis]|nr:transcriptional regulator FixK [Chlamydia trachomatis]